MVKTTSACLRKGFPGRVKTGQRQFGTVRSEVRILSPRSLNRQPQLVAICRQLAALFLCGKEDGYLKQNHHHYRFQIDLSFLLVNLVTVDATRSMSCGFRK